MHHHYKEPDVCQPFKTTRDCDKRHLSCLSPQRRAGLKQDKQLQWWDYNARVGASSPGVSTMVPSPSPPYYTHTHTYTHVKRGPATTATKKNPQWHCLRTTMNLLLFDSTHKSTHALSHVWWTPPNKKTHTL